MLVFRLRGGAAVVVACPRVSRPVSPAGNWPPTPANGASSVPSRHVRTSYQGALLGALLMSLVPNSDRGPPLIQASGDVLPVDGRPFLRVPRVGGWPNVLKTLSSANPFKSLPSLENT